MFGFCNSYHTLLILNTVSVKKRPKRASESSSSSPSSISQNDVSFKRLKTNIFNNDAASLPTVLEFQQNSHNHYQENVPEHSQGLSQKPPLVTSEEHTLKLQQELSRKSSNVPYSDLPLCTNNIKVGENNINNTGNNTIQINTDHSYNQEASSNSTSEGLQRWLQHQQLHNQDADLEHDGINSDVFLLDDLVEKHMIFSDEFLSIANEEEVMDVDDEGE